MLFSVAFRHRHTGQLTRACTLFDNVEPAKRVCEQHIRQAQKAPSRNYDPVLVTVDPKTHELREHDACLVDTGPARD